MHHIRFDDICWHAPATNPEEVDLATEVPPSEPGRKFLVDGQSGFYVQTVRLPPHFEAPAHHHSHAEVFMVLDGSCEFSGRPMRRHDLAVVEAGESYGFTAGPDGVVFATTRQGQATFSEDT
jgi:quercetin dioxygenase-like cupin family protein